MRARNVKPGLFSCEEVANCDPLARILFVGLWCMADRDGKLEDRPRRIAVQVLPYDDAQAKIEGLLSELAKNNLIQRYTAPDAAGNDVAVIKVLNFKKHQNPHPRETASVLPEPIDSQQHKAKPAFERSGDRKEAVDFHGSPFQGKPELTCQVGSSPLIPSSLIPEGLIQGATASKALMHEGATASPPSGPVPPKASSPASKPAVAFSNTPAGLAQDFCFAQMGRKESVYEVGEQIEAMVQFGYTVKQIRDEMSLNRERSERFWQLKKRLEKVGPRPVVEKPEEDVAVQCQRRAEKHARDLAECRSSGISAKEFVRQRTEAMRLEAEEKAKSKREELIKLPEYQQVAALQQAS